MYFRSFKMDFVKTVQSSVSFQTPAIDELCQLFDPQNSNENKYYLPLESSIVYELNNSGCDYETLEPFTIDPHKNNILYNITIIDKPDLNQQKINISSNKKKSSPNVTDYTCSLCPYLTNYRPNLSKHRKSVHPKQCFFCNQCDWNTTTKTCLNRHIKTIHSKKVFYCKQCDFQTCYSDTFALHSKRIHK